MPDQLEFMGQTIEGKLVQTTRHQYDFQSFFGKPPYRSSMMAYVFVPLQSDKPQNVTLGLGADYYMRAWINGQRIEASGGMIL